MRRYWGGLLAAVLTVTTLAPASASAQESMQCPEVAIVAARGSEQNGPEDVIPTRYAEDSPWESNGYEGRNIRGLLQLAEHRHAEATGESLLRDVPVIALDPSIYPAALPLPAIAQPDEQITALETMLRLAGILIERPAHQIAGDAIGSSVASVESGVEHAPSYVQAWEEATGCQPDYLLLGFSQGVLVLGAQEQQLADAGRLRGVVYLGNPVLRPGEPSIVASAGEQPAGGALRGVVKQVPPPAEGVPRVNYCLHEDFVCDAGLESAALALRTGLGVHTLYFANAGDTPVGVERRTTPTDERVADLTAGMILGDV